MICCHFFNTIHTNNPQLENFLLIVLFVTFQEEEYYVCIHSHRYADTILFHHEGGVDIGDVDAKVSVLIL